MGVNKFTSQMGVNKFLVSNDCKNILAVKLEYKYFTF